MKRKLLELETIVSVDLARDTDLTELLFSDSKGASYDPVPPIGGSGDVMVGDEMDTDDNDILEVNNCNAIISSLDKSAYKRREKAGSQEGDRLPEEGLIVVAGENLVARPFVTLDDLSSVDEDDILAVAIRAAWNFPRPRHWGFRTM